jgi:hypothetical protein
MTQPENQAEALKAAIRAAKLALFVIRKQGVMPNSSWESGFNSDLATAEAALAALPEAPAVPVGESLDSQIDRLANFIMAEVPFEPSQSEGAVDTAIRWMRSGLQSSPPVKATAVDGEIDRLRKALIAAGRHVGAGLADDVSTDFLMLVPEEVRLVMERHLAALASQAAGEGEAVAWARKPLVTEELAMRMAAKEVGDIRQLVDVSSQHRT